MHRARAVVVVDESCDAAEMAARGARWARFNAVGGNGAPLDRLERLAERIAPLGWHVQLYAPADALPALEPVLRRLPVPVVVDHLGGVKAAAGGVEHPGFRALLRLVENGAWAKLCGYRASAGPPCGEVAPMARALLAAAPDRRVWGTDWPRPSLHDPAEVPVNNPARPYGFAWRGACVIGPTGTLWQG